jgi:hypothetical protein
VVVPKIASLGALCKMLYCGNHQGCSNFDIGHGRSKKLVTLPLRLEELILMIGIDHQE